MSLQQIWTYCRIAGGGKGGDGEGIAYEEACRRVAEWRRQQAEVKHEAG